jgi:hypothetical protein
MNTVDIYLNFKRSIALLRQLSKEYTETPNEHTLECMEIVKQSILDLLVKMESCETLIG